MPAADPASAPPAIHQLLAAHRAVDEAGAACDRAFRLSLEAPPGASRAARRALDQAERDLAEAMRRLALARDALETTRQQPPEEKSWGAH
jgi:hypothetical protein